MASRTRVTQRHESATKKLIAIFMAFLLIFTYLNLPLAPSALAEENEGDVIAPASVIEDGETLEVITSDETTPAVEETEGVDASEDVDEPDAPKTETSAAPEQSKPAAEKAPAKAPAAGTNEATDPTDEAAETEPQVEEPQAAQIVPIEQIYIAPNKTQVTVGDEVTAKLVIAPEDATREAVQWNFDSDKAEIVSGAGTETVTLKTKAAGTLELTAVVTVSAEKNLTDSAKISIGVAPVSAKSVEIAGWDREYLKVGEEVTLSATVLPEEAADKTVKWTSSDESILTVDNTGKVTATGQGIATVRVETMTGAYSEASLKVFNGEPYQLTVYSFRTSKYLKHHSVVTIPADNQPVAIADYLARGISDGENTYTFGGSVMNASFNLKNGNLDGAGLNEENEFTTEVYASFPRVTYVKSDGKNVECSTDGNSWFAVEKICAIYHLNKANKLDTADPAAITVSVMDWADDSKNYKKILRIYVYDEDADNALIYDSGNMVYWSTAAPKGGITFETLDSLYEVKKIIVKAEKGRDPQSNPVSCGGKDYSFTSVGEYTAANTDEFPFAVTVGFDGTSSAQTYSVSAYVSAKAFDVKYELDGGSAPEGVDYGSESIKPVNDATVTVKDGTPTKDGYIFGGWQFDGTVYQPGDEFPMPTKDVELKAWWIPASEMATYSVNIPGAGVISNTSDRIGEGAHVLGSTASANGNGSAFVGWYHASDIAGNDLPDSTASAVSNDSSFVPTESGEYVAVFLMASAKVSNYQGIYDAQEHEATYEVSGPHADLVTLKVSDGLKAVDGSMPKRTDVGLEAKSIALVANDYAGVNVWTGTASVEITPRDVVVTLPDVEITYGQEVAEADFNGAIEGLLEGDSSELNLRYGVAVDDDGMTIRHVNYSQDEEAAVIPHEGAIVALSEAVLENGNYQVSKVVPGNLTINPAPVKVIVDEASKTVGEEDPVFTGRVEGMVNDEVFPEEIEFYREGVGEDEAVGTYEGVLKAVYPEDAAVLRNYNVEVVPANFTINEVPVTPVPDSGADDDPTPVPTTTPDATPTPDAPGAGDATVTPAVVTPAVPAVAVAPAVTTIADDAVPMAEPQQVNIADDETPMAAFDAPHCWVHFWIMLGMIITAVYGVGVVMRRRGWTRDIDDFEDNVMGGEKVTEKERAFAPSASRVSA